MSEQHTICTCGKIRFTSWRAAARNAHGIMRQRKASRAMIPYWSRSCRAWHVGRATDHIRRRHQHREERYA